MIGHQIHFIRTLPYVIILLQVFGGGNIIFGCHVGCMHTAVGVGMPSEEEDGR